MNDPKKGLRPVHRNLRIAGIVVILLSVASCYLGDNTEEAAKQGMGIAFIGVVFLLLSFGGRL